MYLRDRFHPHLSLASHDLYGRPDLQADVARFAMSLPVSYSTEFLGDTIAVYRFEHPTWEDRWWEQMTWAHVRSWRLTDARAAQPLP